jgi:ribonucleoside-diphosphate reductase alpha chain
MWHDLDERQEIVLSKYRQKGESIPQFIDRVTFGNAELKKIFEQKEGIWGGRNLYAIGREGNITGSNCYVATDPTDSLEDIYRADYHLARTYSYGGGQGLNLSKIRPKNSAVNNTSNTSPGPMVFAEKFSHTTLNTQQEQRRGALMLVMNIDHPDIIDFATAKLDLNKINGANISIAMTNDFFTAVALDEDWEMEFETPYQFIKKIVRAKDLMDVITYANHTMGDPGMLFIDNVNDYHLLSHYPNVKYTATNPCGEQPLMANGSCNLGSINLYAFVRNNFKADAWFDFKRFGQVVREMIWGLDELLDMLGERHALPEQRQHVKDWREVGLGIMGLADLALGMGMEYGSIRFNEFLQEIMKHMINEAVRASALRAKEKGVFPMYNYEYTAASEFFYAALNEETRAMVLEHGLRNSRLLSIAPTGSISNVLGVSGGVEPFFMLGYNRNIKSIFEDEKIITVWEKTPKEFARFLGIDTLDELPKWAKITSQNIDIDARLQVQSIIQRYVDTGISSTFNLPNDANTDVIEDIYTKANGMRLKGITVFRDNCAKVGILSGANGWLTDENPAVPPEIQVREYWLDKKTGEERQFITKINIDPFTRQTMTERKYMDVCPVCDAPLIKQGGCTKCSNHDCYYELCAV